MNVRSEPCSGKRGLNPFPNVKFETSKLKGFADDHFKFDEIGMVSSDRVENSVGKREIVHYELVLTQIFLLLVPFNPLPNDKILDWSKLKAVAEDNINASEKLKFVFGWVENIVGKGENAGFQYFLLFPQCFQKAFFIGSLNVGIVW